MTSSNNKHIDGSGLSHLFGLLKGKYGEPEAPYTEVEWVESNGKQFVYLDWKPKIATWGFEADFIVRNAFSTSGGAWRSDTNANGFGNVFGTRNASGVNDIQLTTYGSYGSLRNGSSNYTTSGLFKTDKTRQQISYHGTSLKRGDGTTVTFSSRAESPNKYYTNMVVFAMHEGLRRSGYGNPVQPGSVRIYSLKFYDSDVLECDLVGAIRKSDGVTGLYDKVAGKFYPAPGCTYGNAVGDLGKVPDISSSLNGTVPYLVAYNDTNTRMLRVNAPTLDKLEDGQSIRLTYLYAIGNSYQTTELAGWDDTSNNSNVYIKLTLSDDSETEWIPCYYNAYTHLTTHYYAGSPLLLTYRENVFIGATATSSGTAVMRGFWVDQDYNTNTTANNYSDTVIAGLNGVGRYTLCMRDANDNWTKIVNENNKYGVSDKTAYAGGLRLGKIIYHNYGSDISAGSNTGSMLGSAIAADLRYSLNGIANANTTTLQFRKPVYLVGTVNASDGLFYLDQTKWWSQELPISDDGKVYVLLGWAYGSYYAAYLSEYNPAYVYKNGHIQELTNGHVVQKDVPADAVFTDTTALGSMTGTLGVAHGGTGQTSEVNAANSFLNALTTGSSDPQDNDYYISQYAGGGTTTTTFHRRPVSKLWNYIKSKISSWMKNNTSTGALGWSSSSNDTMPVTSNTLAYWNGAYSGTSSNLEYTKKGQLGTAAFVNGIEAVSLGSGTAIAANTDLNTLFTKGNYTCAMDATAATLSNCPSSNAFTMVIRYATGGAYPMQVLTRYIDGHTWVRKNNSTTNTSGWSSWIERYDSAAGTVSIARGGTGATTAEAAWTALGGGAIGKKASLAASDIPSLSTDKLTSGTLGVARGGTGKATHTSNAVLTGNGTSAVNNVATASGALYATSANGAPSFGTLPIAQGGTGKTTAADAWTALGGGAIGKKASLAASDIPSHASTATTYGVGTNANYGHLKLSDSTSSSSGTSGGIAATPSAVKAAYDLANTANTTAGNALSAATGALAFKVTYSISNGTTTCAAHVYSAGAEVTSTFADSCFQWYYDIGSGWVSLGTGKTKAVTTLSDFGGNVKCDFTPPES